MRFSESGDQTAPVQNIKIIGQEKVGNRIFFGDLSVTSVNSLCLFYSPESIIVAQGLNKNGRSKRDANNGDITHGILHGLTRGLLR